MKITSCNIEKNDNNSIVVIRNLNASQENKNLVLSILDLDLDLLEETNLINSPLSLEACLIEGVDPKQLLYKTKDSFLTKHGTNVQEIKFHYAENSRRQLINKVKERRLKLVKEKIRSENLWEGRTSKFIKSNTTIKASKTDNIQHKPSFIRVYKKTKVDQLPSINKNHRKELPELKIKDGFEESSLEYNRIRSVSPMLLGIGKGKFAVMDSSIRKEDLKIKTRSSISTKRSQSVSLRTNIHTLNNQNNTTGQKYIQKIITNVKTGHKKFALQQKVKNLVDIREEIQNREKDEKLKIELENKKQKNINRFTIEEKEAMEHKKIESEKFRRELQDIENESKKVSTIIHSKLLPTDRSSRSNTSLENKNATLDILFSRFRKLENEKIKKLKTKELTTEMKLNSLRQDKEKSQVLKKMQNQERIDRQIQLQTEKQKILDDLNSEYLNSIENKQRQIQNKIVISKLEHQKRSLLKNQKIVNTIFEAKRKQEEKQRNIIEKYQTDVSRLEQKKIKLSQRTKDNREIAMFKEELKRQNLLINSKKDNYKMQRLEERLKQEETNHKNMKIERAKISNTLTNQQIAKSAQKQKINDTLFQMAVWNHFDENLILNILQKEGKENTRNIGLNEILRAKHRNKSNMEKKGGIDSLAEINKEISRNKQNLKSNTVE